MYVSIGLAARHYDVTTQTISRWGQSGDIDFITLPSGRRKYGIAGRGNTNIVTRPSDTPRERAIYCRVSSQGQKPELEHQIAYMRGKYPGYELYSDIGSGLNWKRKGLKTLLRRCMQGKVKTIAVAHKDRLARFGYDIIEFMLAECGVRLLCEHEAIHQSKEQELADDILSIITVFSSRVYGQRKYKKDTEIRTESESGSGNETATVVRML